jgi:RNA polymerase sigma-70 factor (ECF subfamily)
MPGPGGGIVLLDDQDRTRWDAAQIAEGLTIVDDAFRGLPAGALPGPYLLQAAIAACHARSASAGATPWGEIAALYGILAAVAPGPVVQLNRAVAVAMAEGPAAGLVLVEALRADGELAEYLHLHATRGDLLRRLGRRPEAAVAYERALALATNDVERTFVARRLAEVRAAG